LLTNSEVRDIGGSSALHASIASVKVALDLGVVDGQVESKGASNTTANGTPLVSIGLDVTSDINKGLEVSRAIFIVASLSDNSNNNEETSERGIGLKVVVDSSLSDNSGVDVIDNVSDVANIGNTISGPGIGPDTMFTSTEGRASFTTDSEGLTTANGGATSQGALTALGPLKATKASRTWDADGVGSGEFVVSGRSSDNGDLALAISNDVTALAKAESLHGLSIGSSSSSTANTPSAVLVGTTAEAATGISLALTA
jgi:hypothetical protein